mmetsp:Transcript_5406/g.11925  ORF Transcript_5406/g.11925 Transcript_5406/m.11925 type:complete len:320 (+) Transcript_5406:17-976(+)
MVEHEGRDAGEGVIHTHLLHNLRDPGRQVRLIGLVWYVQPFPGLIPCSSTWAHMGPPAPPCPLRLLCGTRAPTHMPAHPLPTLCFAARASDDLLTNVEWTTNNIWLIQQQHSPHYISHFEVQPAPRGPGNWPPNTSRSSSLHQAFQHSQLQPVPLHLLSHSATACPPTPPHTSRSSSLYLAPSLSMSALRGATLSPISTVNMCAAAAASSIVSRLNCRVAGLSVVSHSCSGIISPKPLKRCTLNEPAGSPETTPRSSASLKHQRTAGPPPRLPPPDPATLPPLLLPGALLVLAAAEALAATAATPAEVSSTLYKGGTAT